jgi:K+-transporting ATPase KdpF subunit
MRRLLDSEQSGAGYGSLDDSRHHHFLWRRDCLHHRVRQAQVEVPMNLESFLMLLISFFLMVYLIYALLRPEKF